MNSNMLKHHRSIPTIYQEVRQDPGRQHYCLVEDVNHQFFTYTRPESNMVVARAIHKIWPNFEKFTMENRQTILAYHDELFRCNPPKGQTDVQTALWVWFRLCDVATDRTEKSARTEGGRESSILSSRYSRGRNWTETIDATVVRTPQALQCYRFIRDALRAREERDLRGMPDNVREKYPGPSVTEDELRQLVAKRAGELHTKQDPWRIFQYYRPKLMEMGIIRRT